MVCLLSPAIPGCESGSSLIRLCSSVQNVSIVCPGQTLIFTCVTVRSRSIAWSSDEYVSGSGNQLFFGVGERLGLTKPSPANNASFAQLTGVNDSDTGMIVLESQLHIVVSNKYNSSEIICYNNAHGLNETINFNVGKKLT